MNTEQISQTMALERFFYLLKDLLSRGYSHLILQASRLDEMSAVKGL